MEQVKIDRLNKMGKSLMPQIKELLRQGHPHIEYKTLYGIPFRIDPTMPPNQIKLVDVGQGKVIFTLNFD
jgi:hypothetical protein